MSDIFISFIHEEEGTAKAVQKFLQDALFDGQHDMVFLSADRWMIFAGEDWLDRIRAELEKAKVVILLVSHESVKRPWVNFEAGAAWLTDKMIIPVCHGDLPKDRLPKPYSGIQAVYLGDDSFPDEAYYLLSSVAHHLKLLSPPPPPPWFLKWNPTADEQAPIQDQLQDGSIKKLVAPYKALMAAMKEASV